MTVEIELTVAEALIGDIGRGLARLDTEDIRALNAVLGDVVEVSGKKMTVARITGTLSGSPGTKTIQIDGTTRENAGISTGDTVRIRKVPRTTATSVVLSVLNSKGPTPEKNEIDHLGKILQGIPVMAGDKISIPFFGGRDRFFRIEATFPSGAVTISQQTGFVLKKPDYLRGSHEESRVTYEEIGGLENELKLVRETVELPLRHQELFGKLGIEAPKGVLLYGPPGTGKTLIARAIASETSLYFIRINGPEIINKFYGESEARLREIFEEAARKAPSVIFIDEIDAIAPKRAEVLGDVEKRVVAQLLSLMDGMVPRGHVVVIGVTNIPEMLDPALRRPGRFDREIAIPVPNADGRLTILKIHSRRMPLASDVDLDRLARTTHGFVGADLEALCKEAGMAALRRYLAASGENVLDSILLDAGHLQITPEDFSAALQEIEPTATREFFTERSTVRWEQIGGLDRVKETLISIVDWPFKYPALFAQGRITPPRGILFTGPSGTGKTLTARALAGETGFNFISISGPVLFSKWLGESEKTLHEIFKKAKQSAPCILFFDELDALIPKRSVASEGGVTERVASQFFNEMDNMNNISQVIILGATNREELIDPALLCAGRLDFLITFSLPDREDRREIFKVHTKERPLSGDVQLERLAEETGGMAGSQIASICKRATMMAIADTICGPQQNGSKKLLITARHFTSAVEKIRESEGMLHVKSR